MSIDEGINLRDKVVSRLPGDPLGEGPPFLILFEGLALKDKPCVSLGFLPTEGEASVMFNLFLFVKITNIYIFLL